MKKRHLRIIGDQVTRYKEDPVLMLRAIRFAAKLGLRIEESTAQPIFELGQLLGNIPPARLFEEVLKLFMNGYAAATFTLMREYRLLEHLFPGNGGGLGKESAVGLNLVE